MSKVVKCKLVSITVGEFTATASELEECQRRMEGMTDQIIGDQEAAIAATVVQELPFIRLGDGDDAIFGILEPPATPDDEAALMTFMRHMPTEYFR